MERSFDVCVVGAGPAGAIAARELARAGASTALLTNAPPKMASGIGETIPGTTRAVLQRLGIPGLPSKLDHLPGSGTITRWGSASAMTRDSILDAHGCNWHLDRALFDRQLIDSATQAGVEVLQRCFLTAERRARNSWAVYARNQSDPIHAQYLIDASGRASRLASSIGTKRVVYDKLVAIWAMLELEVSHHGGEDMDRRTYVEATPTGWWYTALIPKNRRVLAYFTDGDLIDSEFRLPSRFLSEALSSRDLDAIAPWKSYRIIAGPVCVPAVSARLSRSYGVGWLAAGDAAQSFDPLSSNGITAAVVGGNNAAATLIAMQSTGRAAQAHYQDEMDAAYEQYLAERLGYYNVERRWPKNVFWQRRHQKKAHLQGYLD